MNSIFDMKTASYLDVRCCVRLHNLLHVVGSSVVAESLKPVKLLATCKRTQQLPTMLYEVFGSNAMATKLWKELQISLSIKVRGAHPGAEGGTWGTKRLGFVSVVAFFCPLKVRTRGCVNAKFHSC